MNIESGLTDFRSGLLPLLIEHIPENDLCTLRCKEPSLLCTHPARCTGNQRDLPLEFT